MSYDEARDALDLARRLGLTAPVVAAADLLVYTVLLRDRAAVVELISALLTPLNQARGGARPLLDTLSAYFAAGGNAAAAARSLHLSVRALTYRLERIAQLTGRDPTDPEARFALQVATLGAQLLGWPRARSDHLSTTDPDIAGSRQRSARGSRPQSTPARPRARRALWTCGPALQVPCSWERRPAPPSPITSCPIRIT